MTALSSAADPLRHAFPPGLEQYGRSLRPGQPGALPVTELLRPASAAALVAAYGTALGSSDRRAVLSMWSQHYLLALVPAAVATALLTRQRPELALDAAQVVLSPEACPVAVCVPGWERTATAPCPAERLTPLIRTHLSPLAQVLAAAGLHGAVLWSNAGHALAWALATVRAPAECIERLSVLLREPRWIDGGQNPLHPAMRHGGRSACCLRHRLPGVARCGDCPLVVRAEQRRGCPAGHPREHPCPPG